MEQKTKIIAEEGRQDLVVTRVFDLPVELLFSAFTVPDLVAEWMGTTVLKLENKNHGGYRFETSHNGNIMFSANGTIHEILANQKIIRTFEIENTPIGVQLEFLEFEKLTDETSKLTMQIIYRSESHRAEQLKLPFMHGINMAHDRLQAILRTKK
ncbi:MULTISPECIES: SRPBCC domain-containing protein [Chitinophagaceae]